jgi:hypothetical protein
MNEEQIRQIIREEISSLFKKDRFTFNKNLDIQDKNIILGKILGTKIGTETTQKLGFYGVTPVDKPETVANATTAVDVIPRCNEIRDRLQELGLIK